MPGAIAVTAKVADAPHNLYVDTYLTDFSLSYQQGQDQFLAPKAATPIPVMKESGIYRTFPRGYFWRDEVEVRPLGGRPVQVNYKVGKDTYFAEEYALETTIDDRERANAVDQINLDESGEMLLDGKQMIGQDRRWAQTAWGTGIWAYDYVGGNDFAPFDDDASDPVKTVNTYKRRLGKASGFKPNTLIMGANVEDALASNPAMIDRIKYTQRGVIDAELLSALFKIDTILTAESVFNDAEEGEDDDFEYILDPNAMWIGYVEPTPRLNAPTALARFGWNGLIPGAMNALGGVVTRGRDDRAYTDWMHNRMAYSFKVVAADLGIFMTGVSTGPV